MWGANPLQAPAGNAETEGRKGTWALGTGLMWQSDREGGWASLRELRAERRTSIMQPYKAGEFGVS